MSKLRLFWYLREKSCVNVWIFVEIVLMCGALLKLFCLNTSVFKMTAWFQSDFLCFHAICCFLLCFYFAQYFWDFPISFTLTVSMERRSIPGVFYFIPVLIYYTLAMLYQYFLLNGVFWLLPQVLQKNPFILLHLLGLSTVWC